MTLEEVGTFEEGNVYVVVRSSPCAIFKERENVRNANQQDGHHTNFLKIHYFSMLETITYVGGVYRNVIEGDQLPEKKNKMADCNSIFVDILTTIFTMTI